MSKGYEETSLGQLRRIVFALLLQSEDKILTIVFILQFLEP